MRISKSGGGAKSSNLITGTAGADVLRGTNSSDIIDGRAGADTMRGLRGNDVYYVDNAGDSVVELSGEGTDEIRSTIDLTLAANVENLTLLDGALAGTGNGLDNRIVGNDASNALSGLAGNDTLVGAGGDDLLDGGSGGDHLDGGTGNDTYIVDNPTDFVLERAAGGTDTVMSSINYQLGTELENLTLLDGAYVGMGNARDNIIAGNAAANRLDGREGNDTIDGGVGSDTLIGGAGSDSFVFASALGAGNVDTLVDFEAGVDRLVLDDAVFAGLVPGALPTGSFVTGAAAVDADDRIIYDPATGALLYDPDGVGGADAVQFAILGTNLALSEADVGII